jgi:hypothetical protein
MENSNKYTLQSKSLSDARKERKTEYGAFKVLRQINVDVSLGLTDVQRFLISRKTLDAKPLETYRKVYTKRQLQKVAQVINISNGDEPLTETRYLVYDTRNDEAPKKSFGTHEKASAYLTEMPKEYGIVETVSDVPTTFSVSEALTITQKIDKAYADCFTDKAKITIERVTRALSTEN